MNHGMRIINMRDEYFKRNEEEPVEDFKLTDAAKKAVIKYLNEHDSESQFLRVGVRGGGCSGMSYVLEVGTLDSHDHVIEIDDNKSVIVDWKSFIFLKGTILDYKIGLMDAGFKFNNPRVKSSCGCGESFSI